MWLIYLFEVFIWGREERTLLSDDIRPSLNSSGLTLSSLTSQSKPLVGFIIVWLPFFIVFIFLRPHRKSQPHLEATATPETNIRNPLPAPTSQPSPVTRTTPTSRPALPKSVLRQRHSRLSRRSIRYNSSFRSAEQDTVREFRERPVKTQQGSNAQRATWKLELSLLERRCREIERELFDMNPTGETTAPSPGPFWSRQEKIECFSYRTRSIRKQAQQLHKVLDDQESRVGNVQYVINRMKANAKQLKDEIFPRGQNTVPQQPSPDNKLQDPGRTSPQTSPQAETRTKTNSGNIKAPEAESQNSTCTRQGLSPHGVKSPFGNKDVTDSDIEGESQTHGRRTGSIELPPPVHDTKKRSNYQPPCYKDECPHSGLSAPTGRDSDQKVHVSAPDRNQEKTSSVEERRHSERPHVYEYSPVDQYWQPHTTGTNGAKVTPSSPHETRKQDDIGTSESPLADNPMSIAHKGESVWPEELHLTDVRQPKPQLQLEDPWTPQYDGDYATYVFAIEKPEFSYSKKDNSPKFESAIRPLPDTTQQLPNRVAANLSASQENPPYSRRNGPISGVDFDGHISKVIGSDYGKDRSWSRRETGPREGQVPQKQDWGDSSILLRAPSRSNETDTNSRLKDRTGGNYYRSSRVIPGRSKDQKGQDSRKGQKTKSNGNDPSTVRHRGGGPKANTSVGNSRNNGSDGNYDEDRNPRRRHASRHFADREANDSANKKPRGQHQDKWTKQHRR